MIKGNEALLPRVESVIAEDNYMLRLTFLNGEERLFDVKPLLTLPAYKKLPSIFNAARAEFGTVIWPGDIDISPDTLYLNSVAV